MAEGGGRIEDKLNDAHRKYGEDHGLGPDQEVFRSFKYKSPKDKKAAAAYLKKSLKEWGVDPKTADEKDT